MFQEIKFLFGLFLVLNVQFSFGQQWKEMAYQAREAYQAGDFETALRLYDKVESMKPKGVDFSDEIGQTYYKLNDFEKAVEYFQKAKENRLNQEAEARNSYNEGNSFLKQQKYQEAIDAYKKTLRINPQDEKARYNLSEAIRKLNPKQQEEDNQSNNKNQPKEQPKEKEPQENKQPQQKEEKEEESTESESKPEKLPKEMVDRYLDQLTKKELETKKKMDKKKGNEGMITSGKDW
jgi:Ca-activated chloride channel homolog